MSEYSKDHMLDNLISLLDDSSDFPWQAAKAAKQCCYIIWSKARLQVGHKLIKLIESNKQMPKNMSFQVNLTL